MREITFIKMYGYTITNWDDWINVMKLLRDQST